VRNDDADHPDRPSPRTSGGDQRVFQKESVMKSKSALLFLVVASLIASTPTHGQDRDLLEFELEDQFKKTHRGKDFRGSIVLLVGSDKKGVQFNQAWVEAIGERLGDHPKYSEISHLAHADLRGVPFFLKKMIRGKFPQNPDHWVLMDWKGSLSATYDFAPEASNVLVFAPDGALVHHASGQEPDEKAVAEVVAALRTLFDGSD
jgi:hypothetical protein